ncbi:MAG: DUF4870 domain-containing protein [Planctomycetota bacterium]|nr:MAG: DUF4870 domain-containing protein [Planctomycetota bacterium]
MSVVLSAQGPYTEPAANPISDTDRHFGVGIHLSPLAAIVAGPLILAPLVLWLIRKDKSSFVDDHGRETINALISFVIYHVVAVITLIGIIALPVLYIVGVVSLIRGAVAASRGELFRYPVTIRFL